MLTASLMNMGQYVIPQKDIKNGSGLIRQVNNSGHKR